MSLCVCVEAEIQKENFFEHSVIACYRNFVKLQCITAQLQFSHTSTEMGSMLIHSLPIEATVTSSINSMVTWMCCPIHAQVPPPPIILFGLPQRSSVLQDLLATRLLLGVSSLFSSSIFRKQSLATAVNSYSFKIFGTCLTTSSTILRGYPRYPIISVFTNTTQRKLAVIK